MIVLDMPQRSPEWIVTKLGIPSASQFHRILTPKTMKISESSAGYMHELLAEWLLGVPVVVEETGWMERGRELEGQARAEYQFETQTEVHQVGFVLTDDRKVGCSPDGLIDNDGGLEAKAYEVSKHIGMILQIPAAKITQVQGCMWICKRKWWDVKSFNPFLPCPPVRVERDDNFISKLEVAAYDFVENLEDAKETLLARGYKPRPPQIATLPDTSEAVHAEGPALSSSIADELKEFGALADEWTQRMGA